MNISKRITDLMREKEMSQKDLATLTGLSKSGISQYLSGKVVPTDISLLKIADALETSVQYLIGETKEADTTADGSPCKKMTVEDAAKRLGKSEQFIRVSLQRGIAPFGFAVLMPSGKYSYHISPKKFAEYQGVQQ